MSTDKKSFPYLLVVSLCANTLMLGAVAGMFITSNKAPHGDRRDDRRGEFIGGGPLEERIARTAMADLPEADRDAFRKKLRNAWRESGDQRSEIESIRKDMEAALAADEYDQAEMASAFAEIRQLELKMKAGLHDNIVELLASVPADKRKTLIERTLARRDKFRERRGERGGERGDRPPPPRDDFGGPPPNDGFGPDGPPPDEPPMDDEPN